MTLFREIVSDLFGPAWREIRAHWRMVADLFARIRRDIAILWRLWRDG